MGSAQPDRRNSPRLDDPERRGRRCEPRAYAVIAASVEALDGYVSASLLDVSRHGARLEAVHLPAPGRDILIKCGPVDTIGTVVWTASGRCGVQFDEPISGPTLVALRNVALAAEQCGMTPEELQASADWANGLAR